MNYRLPIHSRESSPMTRTFGEELAMEVLTRLSPRPLQVRWICAAMGFSNEEFADVVSILNKQNFGIVVGKVGGVRCVWVSEATWPHAERVASAYYDRVEPD